MNRWQTFLTGVLAGFLFSGILLILVTARSKKRIEVVSKGAVDEIVYEIFGAVNAPGVYHAKAGLRVADAVTAAGGFTDQAETAERHLSELVADGDKIIIPTAAAVQPTLTAVTVKQGAPLVHLNTATLEELMTLPGIGEVKAQDIINYRDQNGSFADIADLLEIEGIGEKTIEQFYDQITVD